MIFSVLSHDESWIIPQIRCASCSVTAECGRIPLRAFLSRVFKCVFNATLTYIKKPLWKKKTKKTQHLKTHARTNAWLRSESWCTDKCKMQPSWNRLREWIMMIHEAFDKLKLFAPLKRWNIRADKTSALCGVTRRLSPSLDWTHGTKLMQKKLTLFLINWWWLNFDGVIQYVVWTSIVS